MAQQWLNTERLVDLFRWSELQDAIEEGEAWWNEGLEEEVRIGVDHCLTDVGSVQPKTTVKPPRVQHAAGGRKRRL